MNSYCVQLILKSALGTPLASDTLWGHIAWGYRYRHGESALTQWLLRYGNGEVPIAISDPLPSGYLPRPILPPLPRADTPPDPNDVDRDKALRKRAWIDHERWAGLAGSLGSDGCATAVSESDQPAEPIVETLTRAGINRLTGGTQQEGGGALFTSEQQFFRRGAAFDVWVRCPGDTDSVRQLFEDALAGGYGRDAAAGLGHLVVTEVQPRELPPVPNANAVMALGLVVPRQADPRRGFFGFTTRAGRLGGGYAISQTAAGSDQRNKRPVHALTRGSILLTSQASQVVGRLVGGVHDDPAIRHCGLAVTTPCRIDDATLGEVAA